MFGLVQKLSRHETRHFLGIVCANPDSDEHLWLMVVSGTRSSFCTGGPSGLVPRGSLSLAHSHASLRVTNLHVTPRRNIWVSRNIYPLLQAPSQVKRDAFHASISTINTGIHSAPMPAVPAFEWFMAR